MRVNAAKTQMLCIHSNNNNTVDSYINGGHDEKIMSGKTLKSLDLILVLSPMQTNTLQA